MYICIYVYMYTVCTRAPGATARAGRQSWGQSACIKCSVTSQSWVVVSGKERGQQPEPFPGQAPGRCGGFGLSGPPACPQQGCAGRGQGGGMPTPPHHPGGSRGPDWVEVLCRPLGASQSPGNRHDWRQALAAGPGDCPCPAPGSSTQAADLSLAAHPWDLQKRSSRGAQQAGSREVRHTRRSAGPSQQGRESPFNAQLALGDVLHVRLV